MKRNYTVKYYILPIVSPLHNKYTYLPITNCNSISKTNPPTHRSVQYPRYPQSHLSEHVRARGSKPLSRRSLFSFVKKPQRARTRESAAGSGRPRARLGPPQSPPGYFERTARHEWRRGRARCSPATAGRGAAADRRPGVLKPRDRRCDHRECVQESRPARPLQVQRGL